MTERESPVGRSESFPVGSSGSEKIPTQTRGARDYLRLDKSLRVIFYLRLDIFFIYLILTLDL